MIEKHTSSVFDLPRLRGHDVSEITITALQNHFRMGHFSSVDYVNYCLDLIRAQNPYLDAVIEINPDAQTIAKDLDDERLAGCNRGPLHGILVLLKDSIATKDTMQTTAGSWALLGSIVSKLRQAGAIIIGKANMSEWASLRSKHYSTGFSPRGGQVRNPFDLRKSPFRSSSGSAVAVSANLVPMSLGTETDTSIIGPASANGVVGFKPTVGLTSRNRVIPISHNMDAMLTVNQDSVGSFGRAVQDAVMALNAISGYDPGDRPSYPPNRSEHQDYTELLAKFDVLRGARFGMPIRRCWDSVPPSCRLLAERLLETIRQAGASLVAVELSSIERTNANSTWDWEHGEPSRSEWTVGKVDAYNGINAYLSTYLEKSLVGSIEDVVRYNENTGTEGGIPGTIRAFPDGQANFHKTVAAKGNEDAAYQAALAHIRKQTREKGIDAALQYAGTKTGDREHAAQESTTISPQELDALLFFDRRGIGQQYAAQAGYPIICIPIGLDTYQMPVSLSIQHTAWSERRLIRWASAIEDLWARKNGPRPRPTYRNHTAKAVPIERFDE